MSSELLLDPQVKYWVLLPISFAMVLVGVLRSNITQLLNPSPKLEAYKKFREKLFLKRVQNFKLNNDILSESEFLGRQNHLIATLKSDKFYAEPISTEETPANPLTDPSTNDAMMNMMKGNLMNFIPQTVIMGWINYFFAGFVVMKLPFQLTGGFKQMLQQGVQTPNLDVSYVSSISWYFVNLLGLRPIYNLILDESETQQLMQQQQQQQNQMPAIGGPGGPKVDKLFNSEADNLQILTHTTIYDGIVDRVAKEFK